MKKYLKSKLYRPVLRIMRRFCSGMIKKRITNKLNNNEKIIVGFLVSENQKWNTSVLYNLLLDSDVFSPLIILTKVPFHTEDDYKENYNFFKDAGCNIIDGFNFDVNAGINIRKFKVDIVFVQQPGVFIKNQSLINLVTTSLVCYVPYGLMVANNNTKHYNQPFNDIIWKYFCLNNIIKTLYLNENKVTDEKQLVVSGHPKVDDFYSIKNKNTGNEIKIIYAPHHSLEVSNSLRYATFPWNGLELLKFARENSTIKFIFKPHPRLKYALVANRIMNVDEVEAYYSEWGNLPNTSVNNTGDYLGDFKSSDVLITDCGSFIAEYYLTGKPLILLRNEDSAGYNTFGIELVKTLRVASSYEELDIYLTLIRENKLKKIQNANMTKLFQPQGNASEYICKYLAMEVTR